MSMPFQATSRFTRLLSLVAATVIAGTVLVSVAVGLTGSEEQAIAWVAPAAA